MMFTEINNTVTKKLNGIKEKRRKKISASMVVMVPFDRSWTIFEFHEKYAETSFRVTLPSMRYLRVSCHTGFSFQ